MTETPPAPYPIRVQRAVSDGEGTVVTETVGIVNAADLAIALSARGDGAYHIGMILAKMNDLDNDCKKLKVAQDEIIRDMNAHKPPRSSLRLVTCDCSAADVCPQGRTGSANRCKIWMQP